MNMRLSSGYFFIAIMLSLHVITSQGQHYHYYYSERHLVKEVSAVLGAAIVTGAIWKGYSYYQDHYTCEGINARINKLIGEHSTFWGKENPEHYNSYVEASKKLYSTQYNEEDAIIMLTNICSGNRAQSIPENNKYVWAYEEMNSFHTYHVKELAQIYNDISNLKLSDQDAIENYAIMKACGSVILNRINKMKNSIEYKQEQDDIEKNKNQEYKDKKIQIESGKVDLGRATLQRDQGGIFEYYRNILLSRFIESFPGKAILCGGLALLVVARLAH